MRVANDIIGKEVLDSSATVIGKVKDMEVNLGTKKIEAIVINKGSFSESIGISKEENVIPYEMVKQIGDKILLKEHIDEPGLETQDLGL
ncbi:MAG: PRC-barrel domain-containing protein [Methanobacterium sp.]|uniref:PRC-barrel domain-containing protein n=1 Tax=Methanobacterium sp. TaxID=2164 RepID=UPI003D662624|nr:PRC-barrel domain-containing protein [Methanobacterium sp.]